jgi:N-acetylmuramoyl-L-alanine amidase
VILKNGSRGENVRRWQEFLKGIVRPALAVDSIWGPATTAATSLFQRESGLSDDGILGPDTLAAAKAKGFAGFPSDEGNHRLDSVTTATHDAAKFVGSASSEGWGPTAATPRIITITAGHTNKPGQDRGAAGNGYFEGVEAVKIRDAVAAKLRAKGVTVREDGADAQNIPLSEALKLIAGSTIAVEVHFNAAGSSQASGVEVLCKPAKKATAQRIANAVASALGLPLRGGDGGWKSDTSGHHSRLAYAEKGGFILETAFISNPNDMRAYSENFAELTTNLAEVLATA